MITQLKPNLWQITFHLFGSAVYVLKLNKKIITIDTGAKWNRPELKKELQKIKIKSEEVDIVILTHNHFDHTGNISVFKNAKIYGSKDDFKKGIITKSLSGIFVPNSSDNLKKENILDINELQIKEFEIIKTPGHSRGGICIYMPKEKILFSGDTIFHNGYIGRTDLPGSSHEDIKITLKKLEKIDYELLCPGHI